MDIAAKIIAALQKALVELGIEGVTPSLEHPADLTHGDYATSVALVASKAAKKNPKVLAEELVAALGTIDGVEKIEVAGPGFINFSLSRKFFTTSVADIVAVGSDWGKNGQLKGKRVMVEYANPNTFKEMHIGHMMSTIIGEAVSRLVENAGADTYRETYQGDIGPQVAKALWGLKKRGVTEPHDIAEIGAAYADGSKAYEESEESKKEINEINKALYVGEGPLYEEYKDLWAAGHKTSMQEFATMYAALGTEFKRNFLETEVYRRGIELVHEGKEKGIFEESDGALVYKGEKVGLHTRVFITKAGTPTYEGKELALAFFKQDTWAHDRAIILTANEQAEYFKVVLAALAEFAPEIAKKIVHIPHGFLKLTTGKMSSRDGNVITASALITDVVKSVQTKNEDSAVAHDVAVGAIKYSILRQGIGADVIFDMASSLSTEGDSGPYLQYSHTRALSVLAKAKEEKVSTSATMPPDKIDDLERVLYRFPEVVARATEEYEPHYVTTYLTELAGLFNSWYAREKIVDTHDPHSSYKVALTQAFATTMKNGLWLLGITAPERM